MESPLENSMPSDFRMGRPSEDALEQEKEESCIKDLVISSEFGRTENGRSPSFHVLENWVRHETDRLRPIHISLFESPDALTVRADMPGVGEKDLKIKVQPNHVTITRKSARTAYSVSCSEEKIRIIDLPSPVTVKQVRIAVQDGVLGLDLAKAEPSQKEVIEPA